MVFSPYKSRNLSPCQKCRMYGNFGRPLQIIQTGNLSHARLFCAKCCTCSNFSRVIQPQPHVSAVYLCISMLQQMIMKHCSHGYESIELRCSSPIPRLETLCCLKFVNRKRREIQDFAGILLMAGNNSLALGCPVDTPSWRYSSPLPRW